MGKSTILLYASIVAAGAALSVLAWLAGTGKLSLAVPAIPALTASVARLLPGFKDVPKQIAKLPNPVTKVVGRVQKLEGDILSVTQRFPEGDLTFRVTLTPDTKIFKPRPFIPYLLKTVHADVADAATRADLTEGTLVTVTTEDDLRETGTKKSIPAKVVEVTVYNTSIQGTIREASDNMFKMNAAVPPLPPNIPTDALEQAVERTYTVRYTPGSTEISRRKDGSPALVHPDELKAGAALTVYATSDVTLLATVPAVLIRFGDE